MEYTEDTIGKVLVEYSTEMKGRLLGPYDAVRVYNQLVGIKAEGDMMCELDTFIGISEDKLYCKDGEFAELDNPYKDEVISKVEFLMFLTDLLPDTNRHKFNFRRRWLRDDPRLESTVSELIDEQTSYLKRNYDQFRTEFQSTLSQGISAFYRRVIEAANNTADIRSIQSAVNGLWKIQEGNVDSLVVQMNGTILDHEKVNSILSEKSLYDPFVIPMQWESILELDVFGKVSDLKLEIKKYSNDEAIEFASGKFISKGYFSSMSSIMDKINKNGAFRDLESIQIFATNSFTFDVDFVIDKHKYVKNAPHLIVVAPKVFVIKNVTVDLTCRQIPENVPSKASDGNHSSVDGQDGKAGLPGYNGGSFLVYADALEGRSYLNVISGEGEGGAGQDG